MKPIVKNKLTIFVNTSDHFDDCWEPFFKLFKIYWPNCNYPIILNTETKDFSYEDLNIKCTKVARGESKKLTWSECLICALDQVDSRYILYLQEDYFLNAPVKTVILKKLLNKISNPKVGAIIFWPGLGPWKKNKSSLIWEVDKKAKWRFSLQAGLWKKSTLNSLIRAHESPWQLESYGSFRSRSLRQQIYCINPDKFSGKDVQIFPYKPTGIVAGKWMKDIVKPLFMAHNIHINFAKRGFHNSSIKKKKERKSIFLRLTDLCKSLL